jgi:hypothetical protein
MSLGNCVAFAVRLYVRRRRRWKARGCPVGEEPYLMLRPSRLEPRWLPHFLVGHWRRGRMQVVSYKPDDKSPLPWYRLHEAAQFRGHTDWGDL